MRARWASAAAVWWPGRRGLARMPSLDWNVLSEGAQVREVEQLAQVEQLLLEGHKKSDARNLASDFQGSPAGAQMLM